MEPVEEIRRAIEAFAAVETVSCGYPLKIRALIITLRNAVTASSIRYLPKPATRLKI